MSESPPRVAAVVLNYNGREVTLQTLASLFRLDYPALELVVVDNGSSDGSREAIAAAHPGLAQLRVEENRGIANGLDRGVVWALERGADYVLVLNNDIEVDPAMVDEMVRAAEADPTIGIVGPKAYYFWDRRRIWSAGGRLMFRETVTRERGWGRWIAASSTSPARWTTSTVARRSSGRRRCTRWVSSTRSTWSRSRTRTGAYGPSAGLPLLVRAAGPALAHGLPYDRRLLGGTDLPHRAIDGDLRPALRLPAAMV
ncbi:MAG: glycosyltransferase [Thermoanaerobaculia bacterium]